MHDLDALTPGYARGLLRLVRGQKTRVHELAQNPLRRIPIWKCGEQLLPVERSPRALCGRQVAEDLAHDPFLARADRLQRRLRVLRERALDPGDLAIGLAGEELPLAVALLPEPRNGKGQ